MARRGPSARYRCHCIKTFPKLLAARRCKVILFELEAPSARALAVGRPPGQHPPMDKDVGGGGPVCIRLVAPGAAAGER